MPNSYSRELLFALWTVPIVLQFVIGLTMVLRRLYKEFPFFFSYTLFHVLKQTITLTIYLRKGYTSFFALSWTAELIGGILGLLVIQEIFTRVFSPYVGLKRLGEVLFRWSFVMLIFLALMSALFTPGSDLHKFMAALLIVQRSLRVIQLGLLFFLFIFVSCFGLSWRHYLVGIGLGFGLYAAADLAMLALITTVGSSAANVFNLVRSAAYNCTVLIWIVYFLVPVREVKRAVYSVPSTRLEEWNSALLQVLTR